MKPEPLIFGCDDAPLFGMLTRPASGHSVDRGVLVCAPLGHENVIYHRQLGILARRLAADGRTVLRFDWPGTGDSAGDDTDPDLIPAYLAAVALAHQALLENSPVTTVDLVGLKIGATLGAAALAESGIEGDLVLWAPPTSGREYLREMRAFDRLAVKRTVGSANAVEIDGQEAVGFVLATSTIDALLGIDLRTLTLPPADGRRILLAGRDADPDPTVCANFREQNAVVDPVVLPGLREVALGWVERPVPTEAFDAIATWLRPGTRVSDFPAATEVATLHLEMDGRRIIEESVVINPENPVFGIVARPADDAFEPTWVVFATNRYARRIGPNRLYTRWARAWAARGVASLRLDLSGTGDAGGPDEETDKDMYAEPVLRDALSALAFLRETYGVKRAVMMGLCSGGHTGFHAALSDETVTGVILLNPQMLLWRHDETAIARAEALSARVFRLRSWKRLLDGQAKTLRYILPTVWSSVVASTRWQAGRLIRAVRRQPESDPVRVWIDDALASIRGRGCSILFVFSEGDGGLGYLERHLGSDFREHLDTFGVRLEEVDEAEHTFNAQWAQQALRVIVEGELAAHGLPVGSPPSLAAAP